MKRWILNAIVTAALIAGGFQPLALAEADPDRDPPLAALAPPPAPPDNPTTPEKAALGKLLFFDGRLSGDGSTPCSGCHFPSAGWDFPAPVSRGYPGTIHWRNSQTVINAAYYGKLFWAGASKSLESQARSAARGAVAGNGEDEVMEARLAFVPEYRKRFRKVFGDVWPKISNAWRAIAAFERTLVQTDTPFDRYMRGDKKALTAQQKEGLALFTGKAGCSECHNGALLSDQKYYNLGVPPHQDWASNGLKQITFRYELYAKGVSEQLYRTAKDDLGLYFRSKEKSDMGKFRTPSLRYTKYTAPYMHNGALGTLADVVEFYERGGGKDRFGTKTKILKPLNLSAGGKKALLAFLESLSGKRITMDFPELPESAPLK